MCAHINFNVYAHTYVHVGEGSGGWCPTFFRSMPYVYNYSIWVLSYMQSPPLQNHFPTFTYALHTRNTHDSLHVLSRSLFQQS